tara:strand:- start:140 stop:364 length:225 start_codon:yes stop_codon:yes gene_type:complete
MGIKPEARSSSTAAGRAERAERAERELGSTLPTGALANRLPDTLIAEDTCNLRSEESIRIRHPEVVDRIGGAKL